MNQAKLYVGNISFDATNEDLSTLFGQHGSVTEAKIITDRDTGRSRGFAFVTFDSDQSAQAALALDGADFQDRKLNVKIARDNNDGGSRGGRGGDDRRGGGSRW